MSSKGSAPSPIKSSCLNKDGLVSGETTEDLSRTNSSIIPLSVPNSSCTPNISCEQKIEHLHSQEKLPKYARQVDYPVLSSSTPGDFLRKNSNRKDREISPNYSNSCSYRLHEFPDEITLRPSSSKTQDVKNIFKPLEEYIFSAFRSFECVNSSFCTVRPTTLPKETNEEPRSTKNDPPFDYSPIEETQVYEMDAKTLLLGDFAENGSWWTGSRSNLRNPAGTRGYRSTNNGAQESKKLVTLKSPNIEWVETNEWYLAVLQVGKSWRRRLEFLIKTKENFSHYKNLTYYQIDEIENDLLEARTHIQRVLLKAIESLLKRPSRPLCDPGDIRFLLIILENPLLYPVSSTSRGRWRSRSRSKSPNPQRSQTTRKLSAQKQSYGRETYNRAPLSSGCLSNILKRTLGLLSNVSNECHHHLVSWFSRYSECQFQKITDLIGRFVTYRLLRQKGRKNDVDQDPTADLVPNVPDPGRNSSAALHAALGASGNTSKKSDGQPKTVVYNDDWQIRAAARVMSLLFSANNSGLAKRYEGRSFPGIRPKDNTGLASRDKMHSYGQIIATSNFYNSLLDCSDLIADFEAWESRRCKFSFCQYPFFLSIWAKIQIMEHDARKQMEFKAREAFFDSVMSRKSINQYLILAVRRDCLVEDSLKAVSEVVGTGGEEIKKGLRITFKGEEGIDAGGLRKEWFLLLVRDVFNPEHGKIFT